MRPLRLIPDDTAIPFMRGRYVGVATSAVLSILSLVLFVWPGLNYSIDFRGGVLIEARLPGAADLSAIRDAVGQLGFGEGAVQLFGSQRDVLIKLGAEAATEAGRAKVQAALQTQFPGTELRRAEVVGAKVSGDLTGIRSPPPHPKDRIHGKPAPVHRDAALPRRPSGLPQPAPVGGPDTGLA